MSSADPPPHRIKPFLPAALSLLTIDRESSGASAESSASQLAKLERLTAAALDLARTLQDALPLFAALSDYLSDQHLAELVLDLPARLAQAKQIDSALAVAQAFEFIAPDKLRGDRAVALAQAGRRDDAVALVADNLEHADDIPLAEAKAGDAYRALGEDDAAEAYYRRSLSEAKTPFERSEAVLRIVSLLSDTGRLSDATQFLAEERRRAGKP
jgi:tetratricopeptide (TPR) repeat protein